MAIESDDVENAISMLRPGGPAKINLPGGRHLRRAGDVVAVYADNTKAAVRLGWNCQYNLEDAMLSAWNWELKMKELQL